jgi:L-iditol 2-dehydrogenase
MRALVQTGLGKMEIREIEKPTAGPGEVIVAVRAALTCGTDRKILDRGHAKFKPPLVMGHEFSGDVVEAGPGAPYKPGEPVMGGISGPCGRCPACLAGDSNRCDSPEREIVWGAFAEFVRIPPRVAARSLFPKPPELSYEAAAILDPLASVVRGLARLRPEPLDDVIVVGTGSVGLLWVAAARIAGAKKISALGKGEARLALARKWGAAAYDRNRPERPSPARVVVECVGTAAAWEEAFGLAAPGGRVLFFGGCAPGTRVTFDAAAIHYAEITAVGSFHYRPEDAVSAREWLVSGALDPGPLFSGTGGLPEAPGFFEKMRSGAGIKYVIRP